MGFARWVASAGVLAAILAGFAATAVRAENPIEFFQRMAQPTFEELWGDEAPAPRRTRAAAPAAAITHAPDAPLLSVPMPRLRPDGALPDAGDPSRLGFLPDPASGIEAIPTDDMPSPRLRPTLGPANTAMVAPATIAPGAIAPPQGGPLVPLQELIAPPPAARSACGVSLARLGVTAVALEPVDEGRCGMAAPVEVAALDGGAIDVRGEAIIGCDTAEALASWIEESVEPLALSKLGGRLTGIRIAAGYHCRNRNNLANTKLSEHGKGNAVDMSAFEIEGHGWVTVGKTEGEEEAFIAAVRKSACGPFKTVLGPGSDPYHADHLHVDLAQRRNGGTYCK